MALAVDHFSRTYQAASGTFTAVDDLSFAVAPGEIVGLIGPNGAGKTTTLRSIAGILKPTTGLVRVDGHDIVADPIEAKRRLAFMPDEPHLFEYLTVAEHLRLVARLYEVDDFDRRAAALLDELDLAGKERSLPGELSRGMRQKSILDSVAERVRELQGALGARDRGKIDEYLDAVRDVERRIQKAEEQSARELPVAGLHVDLVRAPQQLDQLLTAWPKGRVLSLGVIDGRNIWRADLAAAGSNLEQIFFRVTGHGA